MADEPVCTAYVGNLPYNATNEDIEDLFQPLVVTAVRLIRNRDTNKMTGFGFVEFASADDLDEAVAKNGEDYCGRRLSVQKCRNPPRAAGSGRVARDDSGSHRGGSFGRDHDRQDHRQSGGRDSGHRDRDDGYRRDSRYDDRRPGDYGGGYGDRRVTGYGDKRTDAGYDDRRDSRYRDDQRYDSHYSSTSYLDSERDYQRLGSDDARGTVSNYRQRESLDYRSSGYADGSSIGFRSSGYAGGSSTGYRSSGYASGSSSADYGSSRGSYGGGDSYGREGARDSYRTQQAYY